VKNQKWSIEYSKDIQHPACIGRGIGGYTNLRRNLLSGQSSVRDNRPYILAVPLLIGPDRWTGSPKMKGFFTGDLR